HRIFGMVKRGGMVVMVNWCGGQCIHLYRWSTSLEFQSRGSAKILFGWPRDRTKAFTRGY
ncbi:hypothetical protein RRG08_062433, partial [Elysia crispata]